MIAFLTLFSMVSVIALIHFIWKDVEHNRYLRRESEREKREDLRRLRSLQNGRQRQREKFKVVNGSKE